MNPRRLILPLLAALLPLTSPAQQVDEIDLDSLIDRGRQYLEENEDEVREVVGQLEGRAQELRNRMVDEQVPTAVYDRLDMQPVDEESLGSIQQTAERAIDQDHNWAKFPVLAAMRYQSQLRPGEDGGYRAVHLRCELDSPETPTEAVVTIIEDGLLDDAIRGTRWDIIMARDPDSGCWIPTAAYEADLPAEG